MSETHNLPSIFVQSQFYNKLSKPDRLLDSMTSALGYIFPWAGGTLLGITTISSLTEKYDYVQAINPVEVVPFVFHGWFLVIVMFIAAYTGWGRRYIGKNGEPVKENPLKK
jgi:Na+/H+ antiporter NhaC